MAKPLKKKKRKKNAKKKFFEVAIPLTTTKAQLYSYDAEDLEGCVVKIDLTKNLRGKSLELKAKVKLKGEKLIGDLSSLQLVQSYVKRIMRRGSDYIEDSFDTDCKDAKLKVKPFLITRKRVSRSVRNAIRNTAKKHIEAKLRIRNKEEIFSEIMTNRLQKELSLKIKKLYPLALCEIRYIIAIGEPDKKEPKEKASPKKGEKIEDKKSE